MIRDSVRTGLTIGQADAVCWSFMVLLGGLVFAVLYYV